MQNKLKMESNQSVHQTFKIKKLPSTHHIIPEKKILIIYSSGYFGMEKTETGGFKHTKGFLLSYMRNHPNFCDRDALYSYQEKNPSLDDFLVTPHSIHNRRILYKILETDEISDSSDMNLELWKKIGGLIKNNYEAYDAFVIIHGTDTMNYTASVLSFMLENLNKPVILTGSQIPLVEMRNDAQRNLIDTLTIAGSYHIPEVCIMFDSVLYRGNRTIKNDNMRLSAFECPNMTPLGEIGIKVKINWEVVLPPPKEEFSFFDVIKIPFLIYLLKDYGFLLNLFLFIRI